MDRTHLLRFCATDFSTVADATTQFLEGRFLFYLPSAVGMEFFRSSHRWGDGRLEIGEKEFSKWAGLGWTGSVGLGQIAAAPTRALRRPLRSCMPDWCLIAEASVIVRTYPGSVNLSVKMLEEVEPSVAVHDGGSKQVLEVVIPPTAYGLVWLGIFLEVEAGRARSQLCHAVIYMLQTDLHAWDNLEVHMLMFLDSWLVGKGIGQQSVYVEIRSLITELLTIRLPRPPPYFNASTGLYTVLPGDFRTYSIDFMRTMPQIPGASGPPKYVLTSPTLGGRRSRGPAFLMARGELDAPFGLPPARAVEAIPLLAQFLPIHGPGREYGPAWRPKQYQQALSVPKPENAFVYERADTYLAQRIPEDVVRMLEYSPPGAGHRTAVAGQNVLRALCMARIDYEDGECPALSPEDQLWGPEGLLGEINVCTTRSWPEVLTVVTRAGFELADPQERTLSERYGLGGFLHSRAATPSRVPGPIRFRRKRIPGATLSIQYCEVVGADTHPLWFPGRIHDPYHSAGQLDSYAVRHMLGRRGGFRRIYDLARDGFLPKPCEVGTLWLPTDLLDAKICAAHAAENFWQPKHVLRFMEHHAEARARARSMPRTAHPQLRAAFEDEERELLRIYLQEEAARIWAEP
jgi:hypothetical protein